MNTKKAFLLSAACAALLSVTQVQAYQSVDFSEPVSLTVEEYPAEGAVFMVYRVADLTADTHFSLVEPYASSSVYIDEENYEETAVSLASFVGANGIEADGTAVVENGTAVFDELKTGLYLVLSDSVILEDYVYTAAPVLICLPNSEDADTWIYDVHMKAKYTKEEVTYEETEYSVKKQWIDYKGTKRPVSITVRILKNNEPVEDVVLDASNNWTYTWKAEDDGSKWSVIEKDIPKDYVMRTSGNDTEFVIINITTTPPPSPPTGDTTDLLTPAALILLAGVVIAAIGYRMSRS